MKASQWHVGWPCLRPSFGWDRCCLYCLGGDCVIIGGFGLAPLAIRDAFRLRRVLIRRTARVSMRPSSRGFSDCLLECPRGDRTLWTVGVVSDGTGISKSPRQ